MKTAVADKSVMMTQTMRWFGPSDPVGLSDIRQAGATGVVTALHDIETGAEWPVEAISERLALVEAAGLTWPVVESLPVHEAIKTRAAGWRDHVAVYRRSLTNLGACGVRTVTYNFMPVLDWTRTDLAFAMPDGARALQFELVMVCAYDVHILHRAGASDDYDAATLDEASARLAAMDAPERTRLERTVIAGLPGSESSFSAEALRTALAAYADIGPDRLKEHLVGFLEEVCPVADQLGIRLVIHPDDPPFPLFGLPRVVSSEADLAELFERVPNPSNGLCLCTGSLGVRADNDLPGMIRRFGSRIHFLHLRNIARETGRAFHESTHLHGAVDMAAVVAAIHTLSRAERRSIPMRPDHGHEMLDDLRRVTNPGYSAIGRLRGLAELRGLELGIASSV